MNKTLYHRQPLTDEQLPPEVAVWQQAIILWNRYAETGQTEYFNAMRFLVAIASREVSFIIDKEREQNG